VNEQQNPSRCRLHRRRKIPRGITHKVEQARRLLGDLKGAFDHFSANMSHYRDAPARRRLEANANRLRELLTALREKAPAEATAIEMEMEKLFQE